MAGYNPISIGTEANDGTGDNPRAAAIKANAMFEELYGFLSPSGVPLNSSLPTITGSNIAGSLLTVSDGGWSGTPISFAYQWYRDGVAITGQTGNTYQSDVVLDAGVSITATVLATNAAGPSVPATSLPLAMIAPVVAKRRYWGFHGEPSLTLSNTQITEELASDLSTGRAMSKFNTAPGGERFYYAYPESLLESGAVYLGDALDNISQIFNQIGGFVHSTQTVTPTGGTPEMYHIYRSVDPYLAGDIAHQFV